MIDVENLVFDYPGRRALHGVSLHIEAGTVTALVGPNGAGKSTLMRCVAGLDMPLSGQISVAGIDVQEQPRLAHTKLGYLSDFFGLYFDLTVAQCLRYAAAAQGMRAAAVEARVREVAHTLGLEPKFDALASTLSRGQRQRLAIGQALVHEPQVLLLDEPASGLDPDARGNLAQLFRQLQAQGITLVISSHILSELDEYSTHILAIRDGRITQHSSLNSTAGSPGTAQQMFYAIHLAAPCPDLARHLASYDLMDYRADEVDPSGKTPTTVALPAQGLPQHAASLLAHLVQAGVPIAAFAEVRNSVKQSYVQSIQAATFTPVVPSAQPLEQEQAV